jgi:predicted lipoprotein with Yx(FWY)xxD motif
VDPTRTRPTLRGVSERLLGGPIVVLGCVLAAGCGSDDPSSSRAEPTEASTDPAASSAPASVPPQPTDAPQPSDSGADTATGTKVITADSEFGTMLYDATGQPIYLFTAESGDRPACYDACAADWPPVLTTGEPRGAAGVSAGLLGTTDRADGTTQVTYAGHPLYYYAHEGKYQVLCHDVEEYGGTWLVVRPDGTPAPG